jgi:outer membrane protein OmpA-like peptidoglycan-associated protein
MARPLRRVPGLRFAFRHARAALLVPLALALMLPGSASAQEYVDIQIRSRVLAGGEPPALILTALHPLQDVRVTLVRQDAGRHTQKFVAPLLRMGQVKEVPIKHPATPGRADYTATVTYKGLKDPIQLAFDVVVATPMKLVVTKETVDLAEGRVTFIADAPVARVGLTVLGTNGSRIADIDRPLDPVVAPGTPISVSFPPADEPVTLLRLVAHDPDGFFNGVEMSPFFIEIPHEEIHFEFGKADILAPEHEKLARTLDRVHEALAKFGNEFQARLYVAGYTDTVGSRESNQDLSERRALAIARWFAANGAKVRVCAQGFGEDAPAVRTPDETEEARNRRTLHVLANQPPPVGGPFPRANWKCL